MSIPTFAPCPGCKNPPIGLRVHPRFSTTYMVVIEGHLDMVQAYFHKKEHNDVFANSLDPKALMYQQFWSDERKRWMGYSQ